MLRKIDRFIPGIDANPCTYINRRREYTNRYIKLCSLSYSPPCQHHHHHQHHDHAFFVFISFSVSLTNPHSPCIPFFLLSFSLPHQPPLSLHITLTLQHVFFSFFYIIVFEITAYVNDSEYVCCCGSRQKGESMVSCFKEEGGEERERERKERECMRCMKCVIYASMIWIVQNEMCVY